MRLIFGTKALEIANQGLNQRFPHVLLGHYGSFQRHFVAGSLIGSSSRVAEVENE